MKNYLKKHRLGIVFGILCGLLFGFYVYLIEFPIEGAVYVLLLWGIFGIIFLGADFFRYKKKMKKLQIEEQKILVSYNRNWPEYEDEIEHIYQNMIRKLQDEKMHIVSKQDAWQSDIMDYYTLWVHQVKTPISAMKLMLWNMESGSQRRELEAELFQMEQYVEMALSYMRLQSDTNDLVIQFYELDRIVKKAVKKFSKVFIGKKISLDLKEINLMVLTDDKWLSFVIEQILSNALKYTKEGKIQIYTKGENLIIEDTGIGIAPEDLPRVCEKGYTGYNGRLDQKSSGLGLYLCKQTMEKLGHTFEMKSKVGVGTSVTLGLDRKKKVVEA